MDEKDLNELLECSVCLERLDYDNKVLPCQHTFCKKCLQDIVSCKQELHCPECRMLVDTPIDDLPSNILLARLLRGLNTRKRKLSSETQMSPPKRLKTDLIKPQQQQNAQIFQPSTSGVQNHCCFKSTNRQNKPDQKSKNKTSVIDDLGAKINEQSTRKWKLSFEKLVLLKLAKNEISLKAAAYALKQQQQNAQVCQQATSSGVKSTISSKNKNRHNEPDEISDNVSRFKNDDAVSKINANVYGLTNLTVSDIGKTKQSRKQQHIVKNDQVNRTVNNSTREIQAANKQVTKEIDRGKPTLNNATLLSHNPSSQRKNLSNNDVYNVLRSTHATTVQPLGSCNKANPPVCNAPKTAQVGKKQPTRVDQSNEPQGICNNPRSTQTSCKQLTIKNVQGIPVAHHISRKIQATNFQQTVQKDKANLAVYKIPVSRRSNYTQPTENIPNVQAVSNTHTLATDMQKTQISFETNQTARNIPRAAEIDLKPSLWNKKVIPGGRDSSRPTQNEHKQPLTIYEKVKQALSKKPLTKQVTGKQVITVNNDQLTPPMIKYTYEQRATQVTGKQVTANNDKLKPLVNKYVYEPGAIQASHKHTANSDQLKPSVSNDTYEPNVTDKQPTANSNQLKSSASTHIYEQRALQTTHKQQTANYVKLQPSLSKHTYIPKETQATNNQQLTINDQVKPICAPKSTKATNNEPIKHEQINPSVSIHSKISKLTQASLKQQTSFRQMQPTTNKFTCVQSASQSTNSQTKKYYEQAKPTMSEYKYDSSTPQATNKQPTRNNEQVRPLSSEYKYDRSVLQATNKQLTRSREQVRPSLCEYKYDRSNPQATNIQPATNKEQVKPTMSEYTYGRSVPQATNKQPTRSKEQVQPSMSEYTFDRSVTQAPNNQLARNKEQVQPSMSEYTFDRSKQQATNKQPTRSNEQVRPTLSECTYLPKVDQATNKQPIRYKVKSSVGNMHEATQAVDKQVNKINNHVKRTVSNTPSMSKDVNKQLTDNNDQVKVNVSSDEGAIQGSNKHPVGINTHTNLSDLNNVHNVCDPIQALAYRLHNRRMKLISPMKKYQRMMEVRRFNDFLHKAQQDLKKREQTKKDKEKDNS